MEYSLYKTLACKFRISKAKIIQRYRVEKDFGIKYLSKKGQERVRLLWKDSLAKNDFPQGNEADIIHKPKGIRKKPSIGLRLKAGKCEWCGKEYDKMLVHQVRTLKELDDNLAWAAFMKRINRKTLVVCGKCHAEIHRADCE